MARKLIVEVVADIAQYLRGMQQSIRGAETLDVAIKELNVDTVKLAETQVAAGVRQQARLREQIVAYKQLGAAAVAGSEEQVVAMRLAENAERRLAAMTAATTGEMRVQRHAAHGLAADFAVLKGESLSGASVLAAFGKSFALITGGMVAFEGVTHLIVGSIDAAREAVVSEKALAAQMKASGESFELNKEQIEQVSLSYGKFGFTNEDVIQSLTVLERGTGNVSKSMRLLQVTADIARARGLSLAQAGTVVAKVFGGQETALRRAVPGLDKNAHGWDLIREAQRKMAGQAEAATTASEKFAATLHNTEVIIGSGLLPTIDRYLEALDGWLSKSENQAKLQHAANTAAKVGAKYFDALATAVSLTADAYDHLNDAYKHIPTRGGHSLLGDFASLVWHGTPVGQMVDLADRVDKLLHPKPKGDIPGKVEAERFQNAADNLDRLNERLRKLREQGKPLSLKGQFNIEELKLAQAQLTANLADDRRILVVEKAIVEKQIEHSKKLKDRISLTQQLVGIIGQIASIDQQQADAEKRRTEEIKKQNQALKDRANAIKSAILDRLQRQQTNRENQRALQDAQQQLRLARAIGGPQGIRNALRAVQDARFAITTARIEAAPVALRRLPGGGQALAVGDVITINVHGSDSPEKVAKEVAAILQRRRHHTTQQTRGPGR